MDVLNWNGCNEIYDIISFASEGNLDSEGIQLLDETVTALKSASVKLNQLSNYITKNQSKRYQERQRENQGKQRENQGNQRENQGKQRENQEKQTGNLDHNSQDKSKESSRSPKFKIYINSTSPELTNDKVESFLKSIGVLDYAVHLNSKGPERGGIIIVKDHESYVKILKERCTLKVGNKPVHIYPQKKSVALAKNR